MRKFGRGLKTIIILIVVILGLTLIVGKLLKSVVNYEDTANVLVYCQDISKGEKIDERAIKFIRIPKTDIPKTALISIDAISNKYIKENVYKGEFVTQNTLSDEYPYHIKYNIPKGYSLVSLKFDQADAANAWNVFEEQKINLVYTPNKNETLLTKRIIHATIYSIKDSQFYVKGELEYDPTKLLYITFLVTKEEAIYIANYKDRGRIDIIQ